jgi:hypothetical protein
MRLRDVIRKFKSARLANAGASVASVALHAHLTAAEKVGHRSDGLFGVLRAGADGEDEVAQGKLRSGFEDLSILFHNELPLLEQLECHALN